MPNTRPWTKLSHVDQLSGLDAAFYHQDSHRSPMHMSAVLIYDATSVLGETVTREALRDLVKDRLGGFRPIYRKLQTVLLELDNPYWVAETNIDWGHHIRMVTLPSDGDPNTFTRCLAELHRQRLDLKRPLWEITLIHGLLDIPGLPERCHAIVLKMHHAAIDGVSMAEIINAMHEPSSDRHRRSSLPRQELDHLELLSRAQRNAVERQFKLAETASELVPGLLKAYKAKKAFADLPATLPGKSHFNARVVAHRSVGFIVIPLHDMVAIKRTVRGVTLNDVAMSIIAGALRVYLDAKNKLPDKSLVSGVPVNLRQQGKQEGAGNVIATMAVGLATHIPDPIERLRLIHRYAVAGKKQLAALGNNTAMNLSDSLAPTLLAEGIRTMARTSEVTDLLVPFHTMISNVPGPNGKVDLTGARLITLLGLGPVRDNMGLFHAVSSTAECVSISFSASQNLMDEPEFYEACLLEAFAALRECASPEDA